MQRGVVVSVLAVVCKQMQELQIHCWDLQCIIGRIQLVRLCKPCVMQVHGPQQ